MKPSLKKLIIGALPNGVVEPARTLTRKREQSIVRAQIERILNRPETPDTTQANRDFEKLQAVWPSYPEYGYDPVSTWRRGSLRASQLLDIPDIQSSGLQVLDVGAGDGMLGVLLESFGHKVTLSDQEDWRDNRAKGLPLVLCDCCDRLETPDNKFDLTCSFNSFEHFPEPRRALAEMVRTTRPGGWIYVEFGPLFNGPWGLHAYRSVRMPYPQFLFSDSLLAEKLQRIGIWDLGQRRENLQYVNKWSLAQFTGLFANAGCQVHRLTTTTTDIGLALITSYPESFQGRGLNYNEVTAWTIATLLQKPAATL